jgi:hypothetical protein
MNYEPRTMKTNKHNNETTNVLGDIIIEPVSMAVIQQQRHQGCSNIRRPTSPGLTLRSVAVYYTILGLNV